MRLHPWMSQGGHKESQDAVTESSSIRVASVEPKKLIQKPNQKSAVNASTSEASNEKQL